MDRLEFINTGLALMGLAHIPPYKKMYIDPYLLIGKGNPKLVGKNHALLAGANEALQKMSVGAKKEGISIKVVSSYRSFERQKSIWNRKFLNFKSEGINDAQAIVKIIQYSTLPGTSRHHWGTEIDIIDAIPPQEGDVLLPQKFHNNGPYNGLREWMDTNAKNYGFFLPYTRDVNRSGFKYEPWHYSFAPLSKPMLKRYMELDHASMIVSKDLKGADLLNQEFLGNYIQSHVMGVDPSLR